MSLLLTVYNTPVWKTFADACGLPLLNEAASAPLLDAVILLPIQSLPGVSAILSERQSEQLVWLAVVQAEYFMAEALETGSTLTEAANAWEQQTNALLGLQRQQRKKLQLFNLHQALAHPIPFRLLLSSVTTINEYPEHSVSGSLALLAACQYLAQHPELQALNTRLQASVAPLCENENLILNIDQILQQSHINTAAANERDLILSQLQQIQEQLESSISTNTAQQAKVTAEREQLQQQLEKMTAEFHGVQHLRAQLEAQLKDANEERDLILGQLQQVQEQLEQYYLALQTEQQNNKHAALAKDKQHAKESLKLEAELRKTKARAANAEYAGLLLQQELDKLRASIAWKAATPVRVLGRFMRKSDPQREKLQQDIGLLLTSEYFDVDWYLRTYTDVAENQINPAEHYLLHGAKEGRLPGPLFDGNWYLQRYPDVAEVNMNPLLHFILYGQQEGRESSPILLTNNSQELKE